MADLQAELQAAAEEMVATPAETGLQVAVHRCGQVIADVTAGVANPWTGAHVTPGTLFYAASVGKAVTTSLAHILAERGGLRYDMRLADVWPEFAACGKERTTVRHVLQHTAGLPGLPRQTTIDQLCDWDHMCAVLADAEPWWEPGTRFGYHALTFGFLLGETLRRATGGTAAELLREVLTGPLGLEDEVCFAVHPSCCPGWPVRRPARSSPSRQKARRRTAPRRPRCAMSPASATTPTCSPPTSPPWAP
jgi:CubicO group peptidase (beta-lactamase class C family)